MSWRGNRGRRGSPWGIIGLPLRPRILSGTADRTHRVHRPMTHSQNDLLRIHHCPALDQATLVLAFTGWMDGGDVSTGTVRRLVELLGAQPIAEIDPEPFYIYNFPGSMELTALFRPHIAIEGGLVKSIEMPRSTFYAHEPANLVLFLGKEPNLDRKSVV